MWIYLLVIPLVFVLGFLMAPFVYAFTYRASFGVVWSLLPRIALTLTIAAGTLVITEHLAISPGTWRRFRRRVLAKGADHRLGPGLTEARMEVH
jgi:hypothetical protein